MTRHIIDMQESTNFKLVCRKTLTHINKGKEGEGTKYSFQIFVQITRFSQSRAIPIGYILMEVVNKLSNCVSNKSLEMFPTVMNSLSVGVFSFSIICESIAAQSRTFIPHGERTLMENDSPSSRTTKR